MSDILERFKIFLTQEGESAYTKLSDFFNREKPLFYSTKIEQLTAKGINQQEATIKARQSWATTIGKALEQVIALIVEDFCNRHGVKYTSDNQLKGRRLNVELDQVKRAILVDFGNYSIIPDGDIIIYEINNHVVKVLAIVSVKNSFRERYTETPYWKLKLLESEITKNIKVYMITPDNDDEISSNSPPHKSRIVMEYELDGIYLAKATFEESPKVKSIQNFITDLQELIESDDN